MMAAAPLKANGSAAGGSPPQEGVSEMGAFGGWVYHLGVNSIGREYCHLRYLLIRGKYVEMYKRDPSENPGIVSLSLFLSLHVYMYMYICWDVIDL